MSTIDKQAGACESCRRSKCVGSDERTCVTAGSGPADSGPTPKQDLRLKRPGRASRRQMTHPPYTHTLRRVKCIRDGASCARCRRLRIPCIQRMTSTTFVVRDDNGLPLAAVPPGAASLHSSSASIATTASASAAVAAAAASGPLPPPAPPASLSRPAPSVGGAASAALGLGRPHMRGKGEAPPPLSAREELQLLAVVRAFTVCGFGVRVSLLDF